MPHVPPDLLKPTLIFLGSGAGGLLRYWLGTLIQTRSGSSFPFGTLVINVSGCLVMGFLMTVWSGPGVIREDLRAAVLIGVLGGYTTFSSFGRETLMLIQSGHPTRAGWYVAASVVLSLLAVWLGAIIAAKRLGTGVP